MAHALRLATAVRTSMAQVIKTAMDFDAAAGTIKLYTGAQPVNPNTAIGAQVLLATFTLDVVSFADAVSGSIALDATPPVNSTGVAAGDAAWFRAADGAGAVVMDGTVGITSDFDIQINTVTVSVGLALSITVGTITVPVG